MNENNDDLTVIAEVLQGRQQAYATLVARYQSYVYSLAMRYVKDKATAQELAQDVFVKAYRSLATYKGEGKFSTWLYAIVHSTCVSHLRKTSNAPLLPGEEKIQEHHDSHHQEIPHHQHDRTHRNTLLRQALQLLPAPDTEVLSLFYLAEQSVEEIATITGLTTTNVKVRLHRARQRLKEIIETRFKQELMP